MARDQIIWSSTVPDVFRKITLYRYTCAGHAVNLVKSCQFQKEWHTLLKAIQGHFIINVEDMFTPLVQFDCFEAQHAFGKFLNLCFYNCQQMLLKSLIIHEYCAGIKSFTMYLLVNWNFICIFALHYFILALYVLCTMICIVKIDTMY